MEDLKNSLLHEIRNGLLLSLKSEIVIKSMQGIDVESIEVAFNNFALNLENDIDKALISAKKETK
jgi:hypothetical protein